MANYSDFLNLILPKNGEYKDAWEGPVNSNFEVIDAWVSKTDAEIAAARFRKANLSEFLAVSHYDDGTLVATDEVIAARGSSVYGYQTSEPVNFDLGKRISQSEWEIWAAREGQDSLRTLSSLRAPFPKSCIVDGSKDANGYPTWMGFTGNKATLDGVTKNITLSIDGKLARIRTVRDVTISGSAGTYYVYAGALADDAEGQIVVDGRAVDPATPNGTTSLDIGGKAVYFNDLTKDFKTLNVKVGDVLNIIDSQSKGKYIISEIVETSPGSSTQLKVVGLLPKGNLSSINYTISDPLTVTLGFDALEVPAEGKIYLGEADFDGSAVTAVRSRHFKDTFISEWVPVDITTGSGSPNLGTVVPGLFEAKFAHKLGSLDLDITIQASQANDGSQPVEQLVITSLTKDSLGVNVSSSGLTLTKTDTMTYVAPGHSPDVFNPGSTNATFLQGSFSPGSLSGTINYTLGGNVTGSLTGDFYIDNSVRSKWSKNYLWIKNAVVSRFYKDYDGNALQTGFIRVIVRKRG